MKVSAGPLLITLVGCAALISAAQTCSPAAPSADRRVRAGTWGGEHVRLLVTSSGAEIEFDCAHGDIADPLTSDGDGRFSVEGTFVPEGGPAREQGPPLMRARYSGRVSGDQMMLMLTVPIDGRAPPETFNLRFGGAPRLTKCY